MSIADLSSFERRAFAGVESEIDDHECDAPARVRVDGTYIPVINDGLRTEVRKDGAMGLTRFSEVYFPREWDGKAYERAVQALDPAERNVYDPVDIELRDYANGGYVTVHRGFVMGVGGGARGDLERRMTVGDPGQLLGGMPIDATYEYGTPLSTVVEDVIERMEDGGVVPTIFSDIEFAALDDKTVEQDPTRIGEALSGAPITSVSSIVTKTIWNRLAEPTIGLFRSDKQFQRNRHTAADVLNWVEDRVDGIFYFEPGEEADDLRLVYDDDPGIDHVAQHVEEDHREAECIVYKNNALHEIRPTNQFKVIGETDRGRFFNRDDNEYPVATARHEPLAERANVVLEPPHLNADEATTTDRAEEIAVSRLKEELEGESLGSMELVPAPLMTPYSTITSRPACGAERADVDPFTYEVESVVHNVRANADDRERHHVTSIRCSLPVRSEDIVVDSEMRTVDSPDPVRVIDATTFDPLQGNL